jgi:Rieske Fe-S protein
MSCTDNKQSPQENSCSKDESGCGGCQNSQRREFLKLGLATLALMWSGMTLYPIYRYLTPKADDSEADTKVSSVVVGKVSDIPKGTGKNFRFGSTPCILTHTEDGQFHAFTAICTHLGCTVQYAPEKQLIWCACHGGCYDPNNGKNIAGPPPKPLTALKVEIDKDDIIVRKA